MLSAARPTGRLDGKRGIGEASAFDFVLALMLGDLVNDALWAEGHAARISRRDKHPRLSPRRSGGHEFPERPCVRLVNGAAVPLLALGGFVRAACGGSGSGRTKSSPYCERGPWTTLGEVRSGAIEESASPA
jgi:hypothetical protein